MSVCSTRALRLNQKPKALFLMSIDVAFTLVVAVQTLSTFALAFSYETVSPLLPLTPIVLSMAGSMRSMLAAVRMSADQVIPPSSEN